MKKNKNQRRNFIRQIAALGVGISVIPSLAQATPSFKSEESNEGEGYTFLFQGDSIADGNRTRNTDGIT